MSAGRCSIVLALVVAAAACGGSSSGAPTPCLCQPGQSCVAGACVDGGSAGTPAVSAGDGGTAGGGATAAADGGSGGATGGGLPGYACALPAPADSAAAAPTQVFLFGARQVGSTVAFQVPSNAASVTVVEQAVSAPATIDLASGRTGIPNAAIPLSLTDARGRVLHDDLAAPAGTPEQALVFVGSASPAVGTLSLPSSSAGLSLVSGGLAGGTWSAVVSDYAYECAIATGCTAASARRTSTYDVKVIVKPGSGTGNVPASGRVDVTFHLTPGGVTPPLSAASAATDPDLQRLLKTVGDVVRPAGLSLGTVAFVDVSADVAARVASGVNLDVSGPCGDLAQLLVTGTPGRQVNVFLVPNFTSRDTPPSAVVGGVDGTIPGPATISPGVNSGVAVGVADLRHATGTSTCRGALNLSCGADRVGLVVAHELGHYLGLYHVTEQEGAVFDPLSDTPTCACSACTSRPSLCATASPAPSAPHLMSAAECTSTTSSSCRGGDNLMFWIIDQGQKGTLTAQQASILRASAAVY